MGHKSLHESAAEILAASVAAAGKEPVPMAAMMNPPADLGGEMPTGDVVSPGAATAQSLEASPKPGRPGAPAEEMKAMAMESESEDEEKEGEDESEDEEEKNSKLMESLIAEHGPELVLENLITEYGDQQVFTAVMEEYVQEFGQELVTEKFAETLVEQYGDEAIAEYVVEHVSSAFGEQEFTDEEFATLQENANTFITEMDALSEEDFDNYIASLNEEELIYAIQLSSLNEGFFKKIGKALKKGVKAVGKVAAKVVSNPLFSTVASFALPGVGTALGALGGKLASTALGKAVGAVGSKIASSALGKGVAALGKTAIGGALKSAAGSAIKSGIGSKLQGGSFSQGAKAGALGSLVGSAAGAVGNKISQLTGSQAAGDLASQATGALADRATAARAQQPQQDDNETAGDDQEERVASAPAPQTRVAANTQRTQVKPAAKPAAEDDEYDNPYDYASSKQWKIKRAVAEEAEEILAHLSSLNEEQLEQFVDQLSDEDAAMIADVLEENAIVPVVKAGKMLARAAKLSAAEKAAATTAEVLTGAAGKQAAKFALGAAAKKAVPLIGAATAAYGGYQGYNADPNATVGQKLKNAGEGALNDVTFGLVGRDPTEIAADAAKAKSKGPTTRRAPAANNAPGTGAGTAPAAAPKYGEKGSGANAGKFWTGSGWKKPSEMTDEERYGKTGAAIRKLDPEAYKTRDKTAAGNKALLKKLQGGAAAGGAAAAATATTPAAAATPAATAPAATAPTATTSAPAASSGAPPAGDNYWDYQQSWEQNPIDKASAGSERRRDDQEETSAPEKTYGERAVDQLKRTGRAAIRTGIGGAILGQDWKDAAAAGATGQVVGDAWKALAKGCKDQQKKQQGMNESIEESHMNGEETTMETTELTEEQIREERMLAIKEAVKQFKGNMREDVDALFNGESLSEEFRAKATLIFESAVTSRVESILEEIVAQNDEVLANAYEEIKGQLTEQVDEYLNYVVEQWMEENQVAIETGLRAELAEDFISGLRSLFQEHYIEIPEEKVDVAETLAAELDQAAEYVETVHQHVAEQDQTIASLQEQLNSVKKEKAVNAFCEGLTAVQAGKMKALAEGVEFTTEGDFEEKLAVLRENYFPTKVQVKSEVKELQQVALNEEPEVASTNNIMNRYVQAIAKTAPKA